MKAGFLEPDRLSTNRHFIRRPTGNISLGTCSSTRTSAVEDYYASEPLHGLARLLKVPVDSIVDDNAYYCSFAEDTWTPVMLTDGSKATASLKLTPEGHFLLACHMGEGHAEDEYTEQVRIQLKAVE